ncbi:MAG: SDR family NAD(P)-dependent oxidoreductase [Polyangiales bacterium]
MEKLTLADKTVLVTGASSGLGLEMARQLARDFKAHPILVARRKDKLETLAKELESYGVKPRVIAADMTKPEDVARLFADATSTPLHAAILNAGVTYFGKTLDHENDDIASLIATNVTSVIHLTQQLVPYLVQRNESGGVMIVSSMASFQPMPFQAVYGGSKAFVTSYATALAEEVRDQSVSVTTFCPGGIATEMMDGAGLSTKYPKGHAMVMDVEPCARLAIDAFIGRKVLFVPGGLNKMAAVAAQLAPRGLVTRLVANDYRGALPTKGSA